MYTIVPQAVNVERRHSYVKYAVVRASCFAAGCGSVAALVHAARPSQAANVPQPRRAARPSCRSPYGSDDCSGLRRHWHRDTRIVTAPEQEVAIDPIRELEQRQDDLLRELALLALRVEQVVNEYALNPAMAKKAA